MKILIWAIWTNIRSKSTKTLIDKLIDCWYSVTLLIFYISSTLTACTLLKCIILKVSIKDSMIFLNIIWVDIADNTKGTKVISELKALFVFWSIFVKFINLSILALFFFEFKIFNFRKALLIFVIALTVL